MNARGKKEINLKEHKETKYINLRLEKKEVWIEQREGKYKEMILLLKFRKHLVRQLERDDGGEH